LVTVAELASGLRDAGWIAVDCRFNLMQQDAGRRAYAEAHIPGAWYADLDKDMAGPVHSAQGGRHPLPEPSVFQRLLRSWGVQQDSRVVCYDDAGGAVAARLWWLLRWFGLQGVAVLDGGWNSWIADGQPVDSKIPAAKNGRFTGEPGQLPVIDADEVARRLDNGSLLLLDARAAARFAGAEEPIDSRAGHVPGAINVPFQSNLNRAGKFLDAGLLRERYRDITGNHALDAVACMCGSGVTACHTLLALEEAGLSGAALYVGSWSDWISGERPIATGQN
jgi:thiosulfate/3-mercaptopyruvate sulfurtransferase